MTPRFAVSAALAVFGAGLLAQAPPPVVRILEPRSDTLLVGESIFAAALPPDSTASQVVFQVDGVEVCRITAPPLTCRWDAGPSVRARVVRVVATLDDGRRLVATVRTRNLGFAQKSEVASVLVAAHVTDDRGRFVPGLTAADFSIVDGGKPQEVVLVSAADAGAEVLLAVDVSQSMEPAMADLRAVAAGFLDALRPADRVTVGVFNNGLLVVSTPDTPTVVRNAALARIEAFGTTALYDTMIEGAEILRDRPGKRALVVFTDGEDVASRASADSARTALQAQDVLLYFVGTGKAADDRALRRTLTDLALETGGAAYFEGRLRDTSPRFRDIVADLSSQYLLAFSPTVPLGDGKWRPIAVRVKNPRLRVRARQGYFASIR